MQFAEEKEFIKSLNQGHQKAFLQVYDFFAPRIFRFIYYKTGQNQALAEDLAQQTFYKTWEYIQSSKNNIHNIQAFLYGFLKNDQRIALLY